MSSELSFHLTHVLQPPPDSWREVPVNLGETTELLTPSDQISANVQGLVHTGALPNTISRAKS